MRLVDRALSTLGAPDIGRVAEQHRERLEALLETLVRDGGFLELLSPDQIIGAPGNQIEDVDLGTVEVSGISSTVTAILADLPRVWDGLRFRWLARPERAQLDLDPGAAYRALIGCLRDELSADAEGRRHDSVPILLALVEHLVGGGGGGRSQAVLASEVLAVSDLGLRATANLDAFSMGGTPEAVAAASRVSWQEQVEAAAWMTETAQLAHDSAPTLSGERGRIVSLRRQTRTQLRRTAQAETPEEVGLPARKRGVVAAAASGAEDKEPADPALGVEEDFIARREAEMILGAARRARLSERELDLLLGPGRGIKLATLARKWGISEVAARQQAHRARRKVAAFLRDL